MSDERVTTEEIAEAMYTLEKWVRHRGYELDRIVVTPPKMGHLVSILGYPFIIEKAKKP